MNGSKRLPDFLIIGAAKSGTSSLYNFLNQHPDIFMSVPKEPCFFDENVAWEKGLDWYSEIFEKALPNQLCGEASTNYTRWPQVSGVPEKIGKILPNVKLIYIMRDPGKRAYSHYVHRWTKETHPGEPFAQSFSEYVKKDLMCLDSSRYVLQIEEFMKIFNRNQLLLITFEELLENTSSILEDVLSFLGVESSVDMDAILPFSNKNELFRYNVVRNIQIQKIKNIPGVGRILSCFSTSVKEYVYNKLILKFSSAKSLKNEFAPIPLSEKERVYLNKEFEREKRKLIEGWNVDTHLWKGF